MWDTLTNPSTGLTGLQDYINDVNGALNGTTEVVTWVLHSSGNSLCLNVLQDGVPHEQMGNHQQLDWIPLWKRPILKFRRLAPILLISFSSSCPGVSLWWPMGEFAPGPLLWQSFINGLGYSHGLYWKMDISNTTTGTGNYEISSQYYYRMFASLVAYSYT